MRKENKSEAITRALGLEAAGEKTYIPGNEGRLMGEPVPASSSPKRKAIIGRSRDRAGAFFSPEHPESGHGKFRRGPSGAG
jgi:hypothetical protein